MNSYKYVATFSLFFIFLVCHNTLKAYENDIAPKLYVEKCSFHFKGNNCGNIAKNVIYLSSDEFLSFTDNWAVGRNGNYKQYMSCLDPEDDNYIDGTLSLVTIVVSGPNLKEAYEIAKQLISEFSNELPETSGDISNCEEKD